ncbi:phosphoribosyl-ATP pyrophosphohydrolase [Firmicutes bacterium CAG:882]|nr:phosphoribosyl-ATP pyrophosphohydrolase [Firmicutes bacterium CAG:882]
MKKIVPVLFLKDKEVYSDKKCCTKVQDDLSPVEICLRLEAAGADEFLIMDLSYDDASHDAAISVIRDIGRETDLPLNVGGSIKRVEDVKKYLYAGARRAVLDAAVEADMAMMTEVANRFGSEKLGVLVTDENFDTETADLCAENGISALFGSNFDGFYANSDFYLTKADMNIDYNAIKASLREKGYETVSFTASIPFSEFKLNGDGLIPVIVQDYKTDEVLMLAYMNEEAFDNTLKTGLMTYYSRSRREQWVKGETSGHYQYVKSLDIDCDNDTLLAKVKQLGAACHTGNYSCFYRNLAAKDYAKTNPLKVFKDVMSVIEDRKVHPKEGSYTNYLFDKGIDKILKKCGEEAAEIIIAAKNPDPEEIIYEISDFLYHVMVLMSLKGVTWEEITAELSKR